MIKKYIFPALSVIFCCLFFFVQKASGTDNRSDSFDVKHYTIKLDVSNIAGRTIGGNCVISATSKITGLDRITVELYKLNVDSILQNGTKLSYTYNDSIIVIHLDKAYQASDDFSVDVYYHGQPKKDPSGWGGFYFSDADGGVAFNLGVGFQVDPHNFGRAWFPCVDNFTERSTYSFYISTQSTHKAFCNGLLIDSALNSQNQYVWHWEMNEPIPSYLASVAAGNYATLRSSYKNIQGRDIDVQLGVRTVDAAAAQISFQHLQQGLNTFERAYAPYVFDRVGFVSVPFSSGAMEHATNIAYPQYAVAAGLSTETLWAHELSHHWWGDLITCRTAEDMWMNEGWASYSESLFMEKIYGRQAYVDYVRQNHFKVLKYAYIIDDGYRAISPMPWEYTYGEHVYKKGADAAHTLRTYMSDNITDSFFFKGIHSFLKDKAFKDVSSEDLRQYMAAAVPDTTKQDVSSFFKNWIYSPGFTHFSISKIEAINGSAKLYAITVKQKLKHAPERYKNVPVYFTFMDEGWSSQVIKRVLPADEEVTDTFSLTVPPKFVALNMDGEISEAITREHKVIKAIGSYPYDECLLTVRAESITDSALVYVEHHWVGADRDPGVAWNIRLSNERYWTIDGIWPASFTASATFNYDGRITGTPTINGYLDNELINDSEDSLKLYYRPNAWSPWVEYNDYVKTMGGKTDKFGVIKINALKKGDYTLAMVDYTASMNDLKDTKQAFQLYPNPSHDKVTIAFGDNVRAEKLLVYDLRGRKVHAENVAGREKMELDTSALKNGVYLVKVQSRNGENSAKMTVQH